MTSNSKSNEASWSVVEAAGVLAAMANERRLEVLHYLATREATVTEIGKVVALSQSALSQHLSVLRRAGLVKTRRAAQTIFYSIKSHVVTEVLAVFGGAPAMLPEADEQRGSPPKWRSGSEALKNP